MVLRCCVYSRVFSWRKTWTALRSFLLLPRRAIEKSANMITWFSHHRNFPHFLHNFQARFLAFIFLLLPFFLRTIANCAPQVRCTVVSYILKINDDGSHWESMVSSKICWAQGSTIWRYYGESFEVYTTWADLASVCLNDPRYSSYVELGNDEKTSWTVDELGSLNMKNRKKIRFKEVVILETFRANVTANVWGAPFWLTHTSLFNVNLCVHVCVPFVQTFMFG